MTRHRYSIFFLNRYIVCFIVASLASAVSLFITLKLYLKAFRKRKSDASPLWVEMLAGLSDQQQKIIEMNTDLQQAKLVRLFQ